MSTIPPDAILSQYPVPKYQQISTQANCEMQMSRQDAVLVHEMLILRYPFLEQYVTFLRRYWLISKSREHI